MSIRQFLLIVLMLMFCSLPPLGIDSPADAQEAAPNPWTVFYLKNTTADEVSETLTKLFATTAEKASLRVVPDARTNALFVTGSKVELKEIEEMLRLLDGNVPEKTKAEHEIKVFTLQSADAEPTSQIVSGLIGKNLEIVADTRTNSLVVTGSENDLDVVEAILLRLEQTESRAVMLRAYQLKNITAESVAQTLHDLKTEVQVAVDSKQNRLLVQGNAALHREVADLLKMLDAPEEKPLTRQLLVRLVWLVDAKLLGENASDPSENLARTLEIVQGKLDVKNLKTAAQMIVSIDSDGEESKFDTTGTAQFADGAPANLRVSGILKGQKSNSSVIELEINAMRESLRNRSDPRSAVMPRNVEEIVSLRTKVVAPDGHSIVLGVSSIQSASSVFVLQVLPTVENEK